MTDSPRSRFWSLIVAAVMVLLISCGGGGSSKGGTGGTDSPSIHASGLAACPAGNEVFSVSPVALDKVRGWVPLGQMNPPAHTFPTDHQYLYTTAFGQPPDLQLSIPVVAPADLRITHLYKGTSGLNGAADYSVFFQPCADLSGRFGHVVTLTPELLAAAGPVTQNCRTYEPAPGAPTTLCESGQFSFEVKAGQQIGTLGHGVSITLDWWLQDRRIAPLHFTRSDRFVAADRRDGFDAAHTVAASSYFTAAMVAQIAPKLGRYDGSTLRTTAPTGGTIAVDVDGTARGYWFNPAQAYPPEAFHAALVPDNVTPTTLQVLSIGLSQGNASLYGSFSPRLSGTVNRPFESVSADGQIYCYQTNLASSVLLQLIDPSTLKLEILRTTPDCAAAAPYAFSVNALTYKR